MTHLRALLLATVFAFCIFSAHPAIAAKKEFKPPEGVKVASTPGFDIYVAKKESKPVAATGLMLNVFDRVVVVHQTRKHGRQRYGGRAEAVDADLLDPAMWQVGDFDGDGFDDYRYVGNISKKGCRTWMTWLWLAERERFTHGGTISYLTDASGKHVKSCR